MFCFVFSFPGVQLFVAGWEPKDAQETLKVLNGPGLAPYIGRPLFLFVFVPGFSGWPLVEFRV